MHITDLASSGLTDLNNLFKNNTYLLWQQHSIWNDHSLTLWSCPLLWICIMCTSLPRHFEYNSISPCKHFLTPIHPHYNLPMPTFLDPHTPTLQSPYANFSWPPYTHITNSSIPLPPFKMELPYFCDIIFNMLWIFSKGDHYCWKLYKSYWR